MINFEDIDKRLAGIGKDRSWLAEQSGRKPNSIRVALAANSDPKNRTRFLQEKLSATIEAEEQRLALPVRKDEPIIPGYSQIFLNDEELDIADQASRIVDSPSLASFCRDVIQAEARRIIREAQAGKGVPALHAVADEPDPDFTQMQGKVIYQTKKQSGSKSTPTGRA
ncbi:hypothetical protein JIN84_12790 [Luteolibacter yonseiensis]|uniref:Uncharacterized protein n=1 Tax=Luteolibacter yonseiensis TaxID=1144680 RepID=A0A934R6U4_9BACT|nr:hypothetical protein [Luteolibacter yonseiensis]MBK1816495.1 hypothetical protein [Luteolibacter yonseiensis]